MPARIEEKYVQQIRKLLSLIGSRFPTLRDKDHQQFLFWFMWMNFKWANTTALAPPEVVMDFLSDNGNDQTIDAFYFDDDDDTLYLVQSKYTRKWNDPGKIVYQELKRTADIIRYFEKPTNNSVVYRKANPKCRRLLGKAYEKSQRGYKVRIILITNKYDADPSNLRKLQEESQIDFEAWNFDIFSRHKIVALYSEYLQGHNPPIPPEFIKTDNKQNPLYLAVPRIGLEAYVAIASSDKIVRLYNNWGERIFEKNVRSFEGADTAVNDQIGRTLRNEPSLFFYKNSGVTILSEEVQYVPAKSGQPAGFRVRDIQIINGQQTTRMLAKNPRKRAKFLLTIINPLASIQRQPSRKEKSVTGIIRARNTQNKIGEADLKSNDPAQVTLWGELKERGYYYERKKKGWQNLEHYTRSIYPLASTQPWARIKKERIAALTLGVIDDPQLPYTGPDYIFRERYSDVFENARFGPDYYITLHLLWYRIIHPLGKEGKSQAQYHILSLLVFILALSKSNAVRFRKYMELNEFSPVERIVKRLYRLCDLLVRDLQRDSEKRLSYNDVYGKSRGLFPRMKKMYYSNQFSRERHMITNDLSRVSTALPKS